MCHDTSHGSRLFGSKQNLWLCPPRCSIRVRIRSRRSPCALNSGEQSGGEARRVCLRDCFSHAKRIEVHGGSPELWPNSTSKQSIKVHLYRTQGKLLWNGARHSQNTLPSAFSTRTDNALVLTGLVTSWVDTRSRKHG